jgi:glycosyltransferase involved in cell wall biosynthesis
VNYCQSLGKGYDSESFSSLLEVATSKVKSKHMNIVYCGRLFKNRKGYTFLNALGEVAKQSPELVNNLKVHYYGGIDIEIFEEYQRIISKYNLGNIVVCHGDVDFESSKKALVEADILLLIVDTGATSDGVIPGKLFEYVAAQKPIFALSDAAATNQIIINGKLGKVLPPNDLQKCKEGVFEILNNNKFVSDYKPDLDYIQQYDRKTLANRMIAIFEQCIEQNTKI